MTVKLRYIDPAKSENRILRTFEDVLSEHYNHATKTLYMVHKDDYIRLTMVLEDGMYFTVEEEND